MGRDNAGDFKTETNGTGDLHQDGNRTGDKSKGEGRDEDKKGSARPKKQVREDTTFSLYLHPQWF